MTKTAARLLQAGVVVAMLVALPYKIFELDRYFVPKDLILNTVALVAGLMLVIRAKEMKVDLADKLLALFVVWSLASAIFATNHWLAQRALGLSIASAMVFWASRRIGADGAYRSVLIAAAVSTVAVSLTCLAQTYGLQTEYFTLNRAPGGTLGNRNFIAHIAAIGLPALSYCTVSSKRSFGALLGSVGGAVVGAALVLSRSRAAWLAVAASVVFILIPLFASRKYWPHGQVGGRLARFLLALFLGGAISGVMPNTLNWKSDSPYLDSAKGMVDYSKGSGKGRLAQYENSLKMAMANPIFGVGPGNWPVRYTKYAPSNDRSLADDGMTANPWPSSDWVAFVSERGFVAAAALLGVFVVLFFGAFRRWAEFGDGDVVLVKLVLIGTIVATAVVSAFDVALLLAAPAFLIWSIVGATSGARRMGDDVMRVGRWWSIASAIATILLVVSVARSATQIVAMSTVGYGTHTKDWASAAAWDPGSYRINVRAGEIYANRGKCETARPYVNRALGLFPNSQKAKRLARNCGG
ncbi:MAG: O-antigen ligase family protein [Gemmatimonadota bacterium]|nr:O-antigen ligase family protein [Gemmatimonadota bacterium]